MPKNSIDITPVVKPVEMDIHVPGDKSISHRSLMFAAMAQGTSTIENTGTGEDIQSTKRVLRGLGVSIGKKEPIQIRSNGISGWSQPVKELNSGNSGTTMRLMAGMLSGRPFHSVLTGDDSLSKRPMKRIVDPLTSMGAVISAAEGVTAPLNIHPADLHGIEYHMPVASAQVKSAIILAGLQAEGQTVIHEKSLSRRHTEVMLSQFGAPVEIDGMTIRVNRLEDSIQPIEFSVPGDPSSAAFWAAAAALIPDSHCIIRDVNLSPERTHFYRILQNMGADVDIYIEDDQVEPRGIIEVMHRTLNGIKLGRDDIPAMIDELPLIAVLGAFANGDTIVQGAEELRHKESDRIMAVVNNLNSMDVDIEEMQDGFHIHGGGSVYGGQIDSYGDHRIAMAFAVGALAAEGPSVIQKHSVATISYPEFWDMINKLTAG